MITDNVSFRKENIYLSAPYLELLYVSEKC